MDDCTSVWRRYIKSREHCRIYGNAGCHPRVSRPRESKCAKVDCRRVSTTTVVTKMAWIKAD
jgi:hypothetical protein